MSNLSEEEIQKSVIEKVHKFLLEEGERIRMDQSKSSKQKLLEADVLLDTMHFLRDYKKNIEVLQNEVNKNRYKGSERE